MTHVKLTPSRREGIKFLVLILGAVAMMPLLVDPGPFVSTPADLERDRQASSRNLCTMSPGTKAITLQTRVDIRVR